MFTGIVEEKGKVRYMQLGGESRSPGSESKESVTGDEDW